MAKPFLKLMKNEEVKELLSKPFELHLLTVIAYRAKRTNKLNIHNLSKGEALIGDYRAIGLTQQTYRTAKKNLSKWKFVTFKPTNKGTIAKIVDKRIFDINEEPGNEQTNRQLTNQQRTTNEPANRQLTTNKEYKNGKNEKNEKKGPSEKFSTMKKETVKEMVTNKHGRVIDMVEWRDAYPGCTDEEVVRFSEYDQDQKIREEEKRRKRNQEYLDMCREKNITPLDSMLV
jgi:hypothetical protein